LALGFCGYLHVRILGDDPFVSEVGKSLRTVGNPPYFSDRKLFLFFAEDGTFNAIEHCPSGHSKQLLPIEQ
jgi:hypothetical protein